MSLYEKLKVLELLKDGTVRSFRAVNTESGVAVLLHWLPTQPGPEQESLYRFLDELPPAGRKLILDAGLRDGCPYIITESPMTFPGLQEWLMQAAIGKTQDAQNPVYQKGQWKVPATPEAAIPQARIPQNDAMSPLILTAKEADPLSVTQTIIYPLPSQVARAVAPEASLPEISQPAAPAAVTEHAKPSEFTRIFQTPATQEMRSASAVPSSPVLPATPPAEPGEFTRMFQAPSVPVASAPTAQEPSAPDAGEFTRLFSFSAAPPPAQTTEQIPAQAPAQASTAPAAPQQTGEPGEFTRMFSLTVPPPGSQTTAPVPVREVPVPAAPQQPVEPGEFTRIFSNPTESPGGRKTAPAPTPAASAAAPPSQPAAPRSQPSEPGEFTRMFKMPSESPVVQPVPPPADNPPPGNPAPGEFTRMFRSPLAAPPPPSSSDSLFEKPPASVPPGRSADIGEFTRIFGKSSDASGPASVPTPTYQEQQGATGVFSAPAQASSALSSQAAPGPSDYTRIFGAPSTPEASQVATPVNPTPAPMVPRKQTSYVPLILIFAVLAACALVLVFYFLRS